MLILHDPATLAHKTIELLGAKLIPALESPERISTALDALQASESHVIKTVKFEPNSSSGPELLQVLASTHAAGYLHHLEHAHSSWVKEGLIEQHESILPECFHFPNSAGLGGEKEWPDPPKDIFARAGFYAFDMSTGICADTYRSVLASANLALNGVKTLFPPPDRLSSAKTTPATVLALCRPPGHHCDTRRAGGYCYINNAVVAVETFRTYHRRRHLPPSEAQPISPQAPEDSARNARTAQPRIAILDLDFHHGNGTQEAFYSDPNVLYISIHGQDEYPYYTGRNTETGTGRAQGTNLNLPLPTGSSVQQYLKEMDSGLGALVDFRPDFVLLSLGFDTFHLDPLGSFKIETEDYAQIAGRVRKRLKALEREMEEGDSHAEPVPCLILLEGGYVIEKLGPNLLTFLKGWDQA
jgi:acetoin utilization deacetylase AcuC-like enzyme